jgi:methionine--tRNA ligase beta chain
MSEEKAFAETTAHEDAEEKPKEGGAAEKHMRQKKEKKPKKQVEKAPELDPASFIDVRIGKIVKVQPVPDTDNLFMEEVDIGGGVIKHVVTSVRKYYTVEQLQDRHVVIFTNMQPAKMCGVPSEAMLFAGSTEEPDACELLDPPADAPIGERVLFGKYTEGEAKDIDKRNKQWKKVLPFLRINEEGVATYKDEPLHVAEGVIRVATLKNCEFH